MSANDLLFAKKTPGQPIYQTLAGHTEDCVAVLGHYLRHHRRQASRLAWDFNLSYRDLCQTLYLAVFLHDLGKATAEFQTHMADETLGRHLSHTFFALPLVETNLPQEYNLLVKALVLSHHTQPFDQLYGSFELRQRVKYLWDQIHTFMTHYEEFHARWLAEEFSLSYRPVLEPRDYLAGDNFKDQIMAEIKTLRQKMYSLKPLHYTKALYCFTITILKHCDQQSSKTFNLYPARPGRIYGSLWNRTPAEPTGHSKQRSLRRLVHNSAINETAIITKEIIQATFSRGRHRIIWVTPGQLASTRRWLELVALFGEERVGLLHALTYLMDPPISFQEPDNNRGGRNKTAHLKYGDRIFSRPVTVTTIDHLIFCLVHGCRQADYALGNLLDAAVIFDGIPGDYPELANCWLDAVQIFNELKVPCYFFDPVSSVAVPAGAQDNVRPASTCTDLPLTVTKIENDAMLNHTVIRNAEEGLTQVIISGSISHAQALYLALKKLLPGVPVLLYHSLFTRRYRYIQPGNLTYQVAGLNQCRGPWVIVATDALLNAAALKCDVLHTCQAPLAVMARRMTLLNSNQRTSPGRLYLYSHGLDMPDQVAWPPIINFPGDVLGPLQEKRRQIKPRPTNLEEVMNHCTVFGYSPPEVRYAGAASKIKLWPLKDQLMDVIPAVRWRPELRQDPVAAEQETIKVPLFWAEKYTGLFREVEHPLETMVICHLPYHPRLGLLLRKGQRLNE